MVDPWIEMTKTEDRDVLERKTVGLDGQASKMEDRHHQVLMAGSEGSFDDLLSLGVSIPQFHG
jgi:hypothetical protein